MSYKSLAIYAKDVVSTLRLFFLYSYRKRYIIMKRRFEIEHVKFKSIEFVLYNTIKSF